jgi:transcriptional regulator, AsnC family
VANKPAVSEFEEAFKGVPQIITAQRLSGDPDYMLQLVSRDLKSFQVLYDEKLSGMPGVQRLNTTLVMKTVVQYRPMPLYIDTTG